MLTVYKNNHIMFTQQKRKGGVDVYYIKKESSNDLKNLRTSFYAEKSGFSRSYVSSMLSGKRGCIETNAKVMLSIAFNISFTDEKMQELLEKYFKEEE